MIFKAVNICSIGISGITCFIIIVIKALIKNMVIIIIQHRREFNCECFILPYIVCNLEVISLLSSFFIVPPVRFDISSQPLLIISRLSILLQV